jgi:Tannase and feruloyl esterase
MRRISMGIGFLVGTAAAAYAMIGLSLSAAAQTQGAPSDTDPASACRKLGTTSFEQIPGAPTWITSATVVAANGGQAAYCEIKGHVLQHVGLQMRLPLEGWNNKLYMNGNHGLGGPFFMDECEGALARNYAIGTTDMGHSGRVTDGGFAYDNMQGKIDFAYRATHVAAVAAKEIAKAFYQRPATRSYFSGCSTGGRQALMEAQRYPEDFDGIIAGPAPIYDAGMMATHSFWGEKANRDSNNQIILRHDKLKMLSNAVYKACDGLDGLVDGIINDPRRCSFDPQLCPGNVDSPDCFTQAQVDVVRRVYEQPHDSSGKSIYPGSVPRGSELMWARVIPDRPDQLGRGAEIGQDFLRYMAFEEDAGPGFDPLSFDFDRDPSRLTAMARLYDASNPDLSKFKARGGKLIMYSGWADENMSPFATVHYYEEVINKMGGLAATQTFARLLMVPGAFHCRGGVGPVLVANDLLPALEDWVENGVAPDRIIAAQVDAGKVVRTRPVFPYPVEAKYKGAGDPNDAANFDPVGP